MRIAQAHKMALLPAEKILAHASWTYHAAHGEAVEELRVSFDEELMDALSTIGIDFKKTGSFMATDTHKMKYHFRGAAIEQLAHYIPNFDAIKKAGEFTPFFEKFPPRDLGLIP